MKRESVLAAGILLVFAAGVGYFFLSSETAKAEVPSYVTGEMRTIYEWAKSPEGAQLLEQMPCYCGCRYEGHKHARHCFWRDDGTFDKHGVTCSVCFDIAKKAKAMSENGAGVCQIRNDIDQFYLPNKHLGTETPLPEGCESTVLETQSALPEASCDADNGACGAEPG